MDGHISCFAFQTSKIMARPLQDVKPALVWTGWITREHRSWCTLEARICRKQQRKRMWRKDQKETCGAGCVCAFPGWPESHLWLTKCTGVCCKILLKAAMHFLSFSAFARCLDKTKVLQSHPQPGLAFSCVCNSLMKQCVKVATLLLCFVRGSKNLQWQTILLIFCDKDWKQFCSVTELTLTPLMQMP